MLNHRKKSASLLLCLSIVGCTVTEQAVKPLDSQRTTAKLLAKDPTSAAFTHYLAKQDYAPLKTWGLDTLTLSALFHHTKLDLAKKQLGLAQLAIQTAGVKSNPSINAGLARSNQKNGDIKPWSYGLSVDIPIQTTNKRAIKIEKARQGIETARMDVAEAAWSLRNQVAIDLVAYHQNASETALLKEGLSTHADIVNMLEKRVYAGVASNTELTHAILLSLKTEQLLNTKHAQAEMMKAKLAADAGLSLEKFVLLPIKSLRLDQTLAKQAEVLEGPLASKTLQTQALLNRIDIRRSIANYATAEAEIKLQVANQTPDITLSPGILFEFGDSIWSLGFSSLLNVLNRNTTLIEKAKQLRAIEGAQFEDLQASIIAALNQAQVRYRRAKQTLQHAEHQQAKQLEQMQKIQKQFNAGLIDKVTLKKFMLNTIVAKQQRLAAKFNLIQAANQIENIMQKPLYTPFTMPNLTSNLTSNSNHKQAKS